MTLAYLTLGFIFVFFLKVAEDVMLHFGELENAEDFKLKPYQVIVILITWPFWLLLFLSFLISPEDTHNVDK